MAAVATITPNGQPSAPAKSSPALPSSSASSSSPSSSSFTMSPEQKHQQRDIVSEIVTAVSEQLDRSELEASLKSQLPVPVVRLLMAALPPTSASPSALKDEPLKKIIYEFFAAQPSPSSGIRVHDGVAICDSVTIEFRSFIQASRDMIDFERHHAVEALTQLWKRPIDIRFSRQDRYYPLHHPWVAIDKFGRWVVRALGHFDQFLIVLPELKDMSNVHTIRYVKPQLDLVISTEPPITTFDIKEKPGQAVPERMQTTSVADPLLKHYEKIAKDGEDLKHFEMAETHKTRRFIYHYSDPSSQPPLLMAPAVHALKKLRIAVKGIDGLLLKEMIQFLETLCEANASSSIRGIALWGPPGTGKTKILEQLIPRCGFGMVCPELGGLDFSGGMVGDTEANVRAVFCRAALMPHLPVMILIDEIDALVPERRNLKAGDHAATTVNCVISAFQGVQDTPNTMIACATNWLQRIDSAFARRIADKLFIGLPSPDGRLAILQESKLYHPLIPSVLSLGKNCTTNFSGANLVMVRTQLEAKARKKLRADTSTAATSAISPASASSSSSSLSRSSSFSAIANDQKYNVTEDDIKAACQVVCKRERLFIGCDTLVDLISRANRRAFLSPVVLRSLIRHLAVALNPRRCQHCASSPRRSSSSSARTETKRTTTPTANGSSRDDDPTVTHDPNQATCHQCHRWLPCDTGMPTGMLVVNCERRAREPPGPNALKPSAQIEVECERPIGYTHSISSKVLEARASSAYEAEASARLGPLAGNVMARIVGTLTELSSALNIFALRLIDDNFFHRLNANDESAMINALEELILELMEYTSFMLIINLDSLAIAPQDSGQCTNERLIKYLLTIGASRRRLQPGSIRLIVIVAAHPSLVNRVRNEMDWPMTSKEQASDFEKKKERKCRNCYATYTEEKNGPEACAYHDGGIRKKGMPGTTMWPPHVIKKWTDATYMREELEWECCMHPFGYTPGIGVDRHNAHLVDFHKPADGS